MPTVTDDPAATLNAEGAAVSAKPGGGGAWVTVNAIPATVIIPVRVVPTVFAATE